MEFLFLCVSFVISILSFYFWVQQRKKNNPAYLIIIDIILKREAGSKIKYTVLGHIQKPATSTPQSSKNPLSVSFVKEGFKHLLLLLSWLYLSGKWSHMSLPLLKNLCACHFRYTELWKSTWLLSLLMNDTI